MKIVDVMEKVFQVRTFMNKDHQKIVRKLLECIVL